ncbi:MAG: type IV secretion system DotC family protein [Gammaproteobacteria bacterium]
MNITRILCSASLFLGIGFQAWAAVMPADASNSMTTTTSLSDLQRLSNKKSGQSKVNSMRANILRDTALSMGARGGLAEQAQEINKMLLKHESLLYRIFNFNLMLVNEHVLPPVLIEGRQTLHLASHDSIRIADRTYEILQQAKFVTAAPTWREYLWMSHTSPETPDVSLLPKNYQEKAIWKKFLTEGWAAGKHQAELIFLENINRLKRDYLGMLRYKSLLSQNMVSPPFVASTELGVTGGGQKMTVDDKIMRITAFPMLQADQSTWKMELVPNE